MSDKTVSVCLIVKNEEHNLPRCLKSVRGVASQVVVVDTGSTDGTVETASKLGAEVHFFPWINDFAAAKNYAVSFARGQWVLMLDADEELEAESKSKLQVVLRKTGVADALFVDVADIDGTGYFHDLTRQCRMFRRGVGIHYKGKVHEIPVGYKSGVRGEIRIVHHGYFDVPVELRLAKARRNADILKEMAESGDACWGRLWELGRELLVIGETEEAAAKLRQALVAFSKTSNSEPVPPPCLYETAIRAAFRTGADTWRDRLLARAASAHPDHFVFDYYSARVAFAASDWKEVVRCLECYFNKLADFRAGRSMGFTVYVPGIGDEPESLRMMVAAMFNTGRRGEALEWLDRARKAGVKVDDITSKIAAVTGSNPSIKDLP